MSFKRTVSFANDERDRTILNAYDRWGKCNFAKTAMWDYLMRNPQLIGGTEVKEPKIRIKNRNTMFR